MLHLFRLSHCFTAETLALLHEDDLPPVYKSVASSPGLQPTSGGLPPPYQTIDESFPDSIPPLEEEMLVDDGAIEAANPSSLAINRSTGVWNALTTQVLLNIVGYGILA